MSERRRGPLDERGRFAELFVTVIFHLITTRETLDEASREGAFLAREQQGIPLVGHAGVERVAHDGAAVVAHQGPTCCRRCPCCS